MEVLKEVRSLKFIYLLRERMDEPFISCGVWADASSDPSAATDGERSPWRLLGMIIKSAGAAMSFEVISEEEISLVL